MTIIYFVLMIVFIIGAIRVIIEPSNGLTDFLMQLMLIDWLIDCIVWCVESISELWEDE